MNLVSLTHSLRSFTSTYYSSCIGYDSSWKTTFILSFELLLKKPKASLPPNSKFLCLAFKGFITWPNYLSLVPTTPTMTVPLLKAPITDPCCSFHLEYFPFFPHLSPLPVLSFFPTSVLPSPTSYMSLFLLFLPTMIALLLWIPIIKSVCFTALQFEIS